MRAALGGTPTIIHYSGRTPARGAGAGRPARRASAGPGPCTTASAATSSGGTGACNDGVGMAPARWPRKRAAIPLRRCTVARGGSSAREAPPFALAAVGLGPFTSGAGGASVTAPAIRGAGTRVTPAPAGHPPQSSGGATTTLVATPATTRGRAWLRGPGATCASGRGADAQGGRDDVVIGGAGEATAAPTWTSVGTHV